MKTWKRFFEARKCGGACRRQISAGQPMLEIRFAQVTWPRYRCEQCAGEKAPTDLPMPERVEITPQVLTRFTAGSLPLDFKVAQGGREVGEDDI